MGEIADSMINGEVCAICGVYLEPGEKVFIQGDEKKSVRMPTDGSEAGFPIVCGDCKD